MRAISIWLLAGLCAGCGAAEDTAVLRLAQKAAGVSAGEDVRLDEVADLGGDAELLKRVSGLSVGRAPAPGQKRTFDRNDLYAALNGAGLARDAVTLSGEERTSVLARTQVIPGAELAATAVEALQAYFAERPDLQAEIEVTTKPGDVVVRPGAVDLQAELPGGSFPHGRKIVRVRVLREGLPVEDATVGLRVRVYQRMALAARAIPDGALVTDADLVYELRELIRNAPSAVLEKEHYVGKQAQFALAAGRVLEPRFFASPAVIRRGDRVIVLVERGSMTIKASAEARNDAALGETVRLRLQDSMTEVLARTTGPGQASL